VPGLGTSFGRGGATTAQQDLANADAILIMGSSMAEQHPVGFRFVVQAREQGATVIHVDPRFTRTSAMADIWVPLRAGSDLVFVGAMINYVLQNGRDFREYVRAFTNAATIVHDDFKDTEDLDGLFSGWDAESRKYHTDSWLYEHTHAGGAASDETASSAHGLWGKNRGGEPSRLYGAPRDETLQHPRCVYQILKRHFARYTPELVERVCGTPKAQFLRVVEAYASASGPDKTGAICYAVGWTQHSTGVQIIRAAAILQQLLGNIGRPGGGILALRGHASIQGSTDIPTLYDIMPGYLPMPNFESGTHTLADYIEQNGTKTGWWHNVDKYVVSLLKSWYGDAATADNQYGYQWLPRITGDHSHQGYWLEMADGRMEGLFVIGQNPAVGAPNSRLERRALAKLDWLVVRDLVEIETASFWYDSPEVERGELRPEDIGTEVFLMPAASHVEKDGCFTNTQRLLQWREKAVDPPGDARSETWFIYHLGRRLKEKAANDRRTRNEGLNALTWTYRTDALGEPSAEDVLQEINGRRVADRSLVSGFRELKADGSTECGCWIYSGVFPAPGRNRANDRQSRDYLGHGWGFSWPADRRIMYNRASAKPDGTPWSDRKKLVWWDAAKREWTGLDVPDFTATKPPDYRPPQNAEGDEALPGDAPFIMHADGVGWIWVPIGLRDGPLPTYYEPLESPFTNELYPAQPTNPAAARKERHDNRYVPIGDRRFPHVLTTYRLTEHHTAGGMSRYLSHLAELQPEFFAEISPELAAEIGARHGEWLTIASPRGVVEARALVTTRMPSLRMDGRIVHQVGLPYHWGTRGLVTGDSANDLVAISEEPNVRIMETKGLVCHIRPGRRPRGRAALGYLESLMRGDHLADHRVSH
jgi:formate dehydrogenase major subunit